MPQATKLLNAALAYIESHDHQPTTAEQWWAWEAFLEARREYEQALADRGQAEETEGVNDG